MEPERWREVERLYHAALEREQDQRVGYLQEACGADEALRHEVEGLLAYQGEVHNFLEVPAPEIAAQQERLRLEQSGEPVRGLRLSSGDKLGPYEIQRPLGAGGMGEVYCARDNRLGRTVALKILSARVTEQAGMRRRFETEAQTISSLNHPNICTMYDLGCQDGVDYVVMEYLEGETLAERLKKGPLAPDQVLEYAIQITDALDTAHRHGVIHRDVKPGNIMLTKKGVKLLDFGLAKVRVAKPVLDRSKLPTESAPLTGEGMILGTLHYMAPEQLEGKEADARSDLFALGAVIYEMATGRKAFEGTSQASLITAIMSSEPPSISTLQSMSPPLLDHVLRTCLAKDPEARWQSAHDVLVELKWIAAAGSQAGISTPVVEHWKRRVLVLSGLLAAVSLAFLVTAFMHFREKPSEVLPVRLSISPPENVTFAELNDSGPALISPDGSRLAFVGQDATGQGQLWVRPLDALVARALAGTSNAQYPFWSPDSRYLGFFADGKLKKVSVGGGTPDTLCDAPDGRGGTWGRALDGGLGIIVFAPNADGGLWRISASGGEPVQVTALDSARNEVSHRHPEFFPNGHHFLFMAVCKGYRAEDDTIFIGDIQAKPDPRSVRRLMSANAHVSYASGHLLFVRDDSLIAQAFNANRLEFSGEPLVLSDHVGIGFDHNTSDFSVSANGVLAWRSARSGAARQLAWFDRSGKQIEGLDTREEYGGLSLSPDGNRIAVSMKDASHLTANIWLWDLVRGSKSRLTFGNGDQLPVWSPDGRRVVFALWEPRDYGLGWKDAGGAGNQELLLKTSQLSSPTDWSRDGRFILFNQAAPNTKVGMWLLPLFGDRKPVPLLETEFREGNGAFSPDGHWIAYQSDESGRWEVYVRPFREGGVGIGAGKWPVSTAGGVLPRWRRDGKELFFSTLDGKMMAVPVEPGSAFAAGIPVLLFDTHDREDFAYDVSPDGRRFLMTRTLAESAARPVNICLNWLAGMKK